MKTFSLASLVISKYQKTAEELAIKKE